MWRKHSRRSEQDTSVNQLVIVLGFIALMVVYVKGRFSFKFFFDFNDQVLSSALPLPWESTVQGLYGTD